MLGQVTVTLRDRHQHRMLVTAQSSLCGLETGGNGWDGIWQS